MALTADRLGAGHVPLSAVGTALPAAAILALAAAQGGYSPVSWRVGAVVLGAATCLFALWMPARRTRSAMVVLGLLAAFGVLSAISAIWSANAHASLLDAQRTLLYVTGLASFVLVREGHVAGVVVGAVGAGGWALTERLVNGTTVDPWEGRLLAEPIGYANGLGALMAIGLVVCVALALRPHKLAWAAPLAILVPGLLLTQSRGAVLAAMAGCAVAVAVTMHRPLAAALVVAAGTATLAVALTTSPAAVGDRASYWHAARSSVREHPLGGTGAGTFGIVHVQAPYARDAHSLYLQTLSELGPVGLVLILAFVSLPLALAIRGHLAAPAAGLTTFALHAGVDWDWQLPAVTFAALALAAAVLARPASARSDP